MTPKFSFFSSGLDSSLRHLTPEDFNPFLALDSIQDFISEKLAGLSGEGSHPCLEINDNGIPEVIVKKSFITKEPIVLRDLNIYLGENCHLEFGALIRPFSFFEKNIEIRQSAYVRGGVIVLRDSIVGHCSELKRSILMDDVAAGHFNYIGDSVIFSHVNLGAGTILSNLNFRTRQDKISKTFPKLNLKFLGEGAPKDVSKLGAIIGEGSETGCNTVLAPGVFMGMENFVLPNTTIRKGYYPPKTLQPYYRTSEPSN